MDLISNSTETSQSGNNQRTIMSKYDYRCDQRVQSILCLVQLFIPHQLCNAWSKLALQWKLAVHSVYCAYMYSSSRLLTRVWLLTASLVIFRLQMISFWEKNWQNDEKPSLWRKYWFFDEIWRHLTKLPILNCKKWLFY